MTKELGRIRSSGMGGFLNPPTHPEHTHSVETDLRKHPDNRGSMSLTAAVDSAWLADETRADARRMLEGWIAPDLDTPDVQEWILQVLGYFRGCYKGEGAEPECWHAGTLRIVKTGEALPPVQEHAGVHLIRKYYPAFVPSAEHWAAAYWGNKPSA